MKKNKKTMGALFLLLGLGSLNAQENTIATGGEATGSGGSASYTTGQIVYTEKTGTGGSESQGLQQPYEISITTGVDETAINLEMNVYPNPSTDYLILKIESKEFSSMSYQLIDMQGKVLKTEKASANNTTIKMEGLAKSTYILNVIQNNKSIKTFSIIKK
jgi:hypothetical protein